MLIAPTSPQPDTTELSSSAGLDDAPPIRDRVLRTLALAAATDDDGERRRLLTFVVVGAGQAGVALAGSLAECLAAALDRDFPRLDPSMARVVLVDPAVRVLPGFAISLSSLARDALKRLGVELRLGVAPSNDAVGIVLAGKPIPSATVLWADGDVPAARGSKFAPVCRGFAVAEIGRFRLSGSFAWLVWRVARLLTASEARQHGAVALRRARPDTASRRAVAAIERKRARRQDRPVPGVLLCR